MYKPNDCCNEGALEALLDQSERALAPLAEKAALLKRVSARISRQAASQSQLLDRMERGYGAAADAAGLGLGGLRRLAVGAGRKNPVAQLLCFSALVLLLLYLKCKFA